MSENFIGVYIHIPFCLSKCPYCDFYSLKQNDELINEYCNNICHSIKNWSKKLNKKADTIYLGGGTPSIIGNDNIVKIVECAKKYFNFKEGEITVEVNPRSGLILDYSLLLNHGINRISLGVQSAVEEELRLLGRTHRNNNVVSVVNKIKEGGIDNISLDLMVGIPKQTKESLIKSIEFCNTLEPKHISAYILKIEENTPYMKIADKLGLPNDDEQAELYEVLCEKLHKYGYNQYEISNFAKSGYESKHNLKYWNCDEYLGIGSASHSFINGKRFYYPRSIEDFYKDKTINDGIGGYEEEYAMLRLRLNDGLQEDLYKKRFGVNIPHKYYKNSEIYKQAGFVICDDNGIRFTRKGNLVSNSLINEIIYRD